MFYIFSNFRAINNTERKINSAAINNCIYLSLGRGIEVKGQEF
jgi:hypothetical protein